MSRPEISILVPSNRIGGCDVLLSGLANQTIPREEFELVLVDNLHARRKEIVRQYGEEMGLNVKHLPPDGIAEHPSSAGLSLNGTYQRALNTGIAHASGRLVMILCDYTYLAPDCLETHIGFHSVDHRCSVSLGGEIWCCDVKPVVHPDVPLKYGWYAPEMGHNPALYKDATFVPSYRPWLDSATRLALIEKWSAQYMDDLAAGKLDPFMYSTFGQVITPHTDINSFRVWQRDKSETPAGLTHHQLCNLKQNSFKLDDLLTVGGMNEAMDGCHGHQDSELAGRLEKQCGTRFWLVHRARAYLLDPHGLVIARLMQRSEDANLAIYNAGHETQFSGVVDGAWLRKRRAELAR